MLALSHGRHSSPRIASRWWSQREEGVELEVDELTIVSGHAHVMQAATSRTEVRVGKSVKESKAVIHK
jgi:hypothetical protein